MNPKNSRIVTSDPVVDVQLNIDSCSSSSDDDDDDKDEDDNDEQEEDKHVVVVGSGRFFYWGRGHFVTHYWLFISMILIE